MYWFRSLDPLALLAYTALSLMWLVGGWLVAGHVFKLRPRERLVGGLSLGFVLFLTLTNLLAPWLDLPGAAWLAAGLVLVGGILGAWRDADHRWLDAGDLKLAWPQLTALLALTALFTLMGRSLSLFDDYLHLPLISRMATGDFPPHFYLNPDQFFAYHYALQVWAASLVRQVRMFPWSAWDLAKAFAIAQTFLIGYLWVERRSRARLAGWLGSFALLVGGGARWLLLLLPGGALAALSAHVTLINTGASTAADLASALGKSWIIEGGGKIPFPFAFHNGVFVPVISVLGSTGALPFLTILLLLLLLEKRELGWGSALCVTLVLANLALSAEHLFAFLWGSLALIWLVRWLAARRPNGTTRKQVVAWTWPAALAASALLSAVQGGFVTEAARGLANTWLGISAGQSNNFYAFSLRWPPAIYSAHLGILSLVDPQQLLVLLLELGPGLLLAPAATRAAWRAYRRGDWLPAALGLAALINFVFPLFLQYGVDRSITRLPGTALWLWLALAIPEVWEWQRRGGWRRGLAVLGWVSLCLGGAVIGAVQIANIPYPQLTYYVNGADARFSAQEWDRLDRRSMVLDRTPYRAVTLFGLGTRSNASIYVPLEDWLDLSGRLDPGEAARSGFGYIYVDIAQWKSLTLEQQNAFWQPCVHLLGENRLSDQQGAWLFDVRDCADSP